MIKRESIICSEVRRRSLPRGGGGRSGVRVGDKNDAPHSSGRDTLILLLQLNLLEGDHLPRSDDLCLVNRTVCLNTSTSTSAAGKGLGGGKGGRGRRGSGGGGGGGGRGGLINVLPRRPVGRLAASLSLARVVELNDYFTYQVYT